MNILYDGQIYADQQTGGISRYFTNLIGRLPSDIHPTLSATYRQHKSHYPTHPNLQIREFPDFRPYRIAHKLRGQYFRWSNDRHSFDIFHPTYYFLLSQESFSQIRHPLAITVCDMIHEIFASTFSPKDNTIHAKKMAIEAADAIFCISENTKTDLIKYYPAAESKAVVTYLASEFDRQWSEETPTPVNRPYFLYVGARTKEYKNFDTLLLAFAKVASTDPDVSLCVVGAPFNDAECQQIASLDLKTRIQNYTRVNDRLLAALYRGSIAFVYPSLYEGFGIPPLEAMACGTVVVAANSSSIPEVVGDAGILFDPKSVGDLADILLDLLDAPLKRDRLIAKGNERHRLFSWKKTAAETVAVYRSLSLL
jgi:glycosyltransferase involved in cell wall biosynthesis